MSFTKELEEHIEKQGWFKGRKTNKFDAFMEQYNYPEFIRDFIREYGGLKLIDLKPKHDINHLKTMFRTNINPLMADGMDADSVAEDYASQLGRKLYVIGLYLPENFDIAVDEHGAVYFLGEYCYCLSKNLYEGLECIIRMYNVSLELDPEDIRSKIWRDFDGKIVDFDSYEFEYDFS